ncbi:MAG: lipoyl synthase [Desulfuromonas sp.]|nr:MAG: lipoyl synthase [Desulfuromonas sp.]
MSHPPDARRKPAWLKVRFPGGPNWGRIHRYHLDQGLHSVCRSAACPNQGECWDKGIATFMILGDRCTRDCRFCNVRHDTPRPVDFKEGEKVAQAVTELKLRHAVITSVTRDDLPDGGASAFIALVEALRRQAPGCRVELLIPDLAGNLDALKTLLSCDIDILGHNLETVPRLYPVVRSGADYQRSLELLAQTRHLKPTLLTKTGLMLGLGETEEEVRTVMRDLRRVDCNMLTLGQYLAPTRHHHRVAAYIEPEHFAALKDEALTLGFDQVESGPLVRSSYHAEEQFDNRDGG